MITAASANIRGDLRDCVMEYAGNLEEQFMALDVLPDLPTAIQSASNVPVLKVENTTDESHSGKRAKGGAYPRQTSEVGTTSFACEDYGQEEPVDEVDIKLFSNYFDAELSAAQIVAMRCMRAQEVRAAAALFNATTFTSYTAGVSTEWSNASGTPYADIQDTVLKLKQNVGGAIGNAEICLAVSEKVFRNIVQTTEIQGKIKGGSGSILDKVSSKDMIGADRLASILGINKVFYSCAQNGGSDIWDDEYAMLFLRSTDMTLKSAVQCGRTFRWTEDSPEAYTIEDYAEKATRSQIIRCRHNVDEVILNAAAGYLLSNITA